MAMHTLQQAVSEEIQDVQDVHARERNDRRGATGEGETSLRISTRTHALLDFATAGFLLAFPRVLGASERFTNVATALALGKIGYSLMTRHELGAAKVLPMKTHLALDAVAGAGLCALPYVQDRVENRAVTACALGLGAFDIAAAPLTETRQSAPEVPGITTGRTTRLPAEPGRPEAVPEERRLPVASAADSAKVHVGVLAPTVAMGPVIRRPRVMRMAETLGFATGAVQTLQTLRNKYGSGPLMVRTPLREQAVVLDPRHLRRVLDESPEPFATASVEKQAALAHFEPKFSLVSHGAEREERRQLNERTLEHTSAVHHMGEKLLPVVDEEIQHLLGKVKPVGALRWEEFFDTWYCIVRRVVFGTSARDDTRITELMETLRKRGNWASLKPVHTDLRKELHQRIHGYLEKGEPGSLAAYMASNTRSRVSAPEGQIPQWLFAFDPAAMATFRGLALLAAHPQQLERAREEAGRGVAAEKPHRPFLRATILESLRLWPTTPLLLRQTTRETEWENGIMPAHTSILIYAPFFHRDETRIPYAHTFNPDVWMNDDPEVQGRPPQEWPFVPFSGGPGVCPGRNVVLLLTSGALAALVGNRKVRLHDPRRVPPGQLPGLLNNYTLRFEIGGIASRSEAPRMKEPAGSL